MDEKYKVTLLMDESMLNDIEMIADFNDLTTDETV